MCIFHLYICERQCPTRVRRRQEHCDVGASKGVGEPIMLVGVVLDDEEVDAKIVLQVEEWSKLAITEHGAAKVELKPRCLRLGPHDRTDAKLFFAAAFLSAHLPELSDDTHAHPPRGVRHGHLKGGGITHKQNECDEEEHAVG